MRVFKNIADWRAYRKSLPHAASVGFVPTMGALHAGHEALLARSRRENDISVLSIFVNPTQFDDPNDLRKYPRTLEQDLQIAESSSIDAVFTPEPASMYRDDYRYKVTEAEFSRRLCGAHRPGHFDGVLTVVLKLLQLVQPTRAYFGEKDYQQLELVREMIEAFFLDLTIVPCPIVREPDGLAMSSRNARLSATEREKAPVIYRVIREATTAEEARDRLTAAGFEVDYVEDLQNRRLVAAKLGQTRLIDNVELK